MKIRLRQLGLSCMVAVCGATWLSPARADEPAGVGRADELRACLADAARPADCIGLIVGPCVERPGGETTAGMVECIDAETDAWDRLLNEEYQATMSALRKQDATGDLAAPDMTREGTLRDAQRAWIAFRDAECRAQYARWGMGTLRQVAGANCVLSETAERAIELRQMREP